MKKTVFLLLGLATFTTGLAALDLRLGPVASLTGVRAAEMLVEGPINWIDEDFRPEAGLEAGISGSRMQVLAPVGFMWESRLERGLSWGGSVHALAGAGQEKSETTFLWGGEAEVRGEWSWSPGIGLAVGAGARYLGSAWEFPLHVGVELSLGEEDTLEPVEKKDH